MLNKHESHSSIKKMRDVSIPKSLKPIVKVLLEHFGTEKLSDQNLAGSVRTMPPRDLGKLLLELGNTSAHRAKVLHDNIQPQAPPPYPPLSQVTKPNLTTAEAGYYLNRRPQTLRIWAMRDGINGLRPKRIGGLLAWSTAEVKTLVGV